MLIVNPTELVPSPDDYRELATGSEDLMAIATVGGTAAVGCDYLVVYLQTRTTRLPLAGRTRHVVAPALD